MADKEDIIDLHPYVPSTYIIVDELHNHDVPPIEVCVQEVGMKW